MTWFNSDHPTSVFTNYGGHFHLQIEEPDDLQRLLELEDGRWLTTSCPTFGLNADAAFLRHLDPDQNGRILSEDVRGAIRWMCERLKPDPSWAEASDSLPFRVINADHPHAAELLEAARLVQTSLGGSEEAVTLGQIRTFQKTVSEAACNGDGVIPADVVQTPEAAEFARTLIQCFGGADDASGKKGVNDPLLDKFVTEASSCISWHEQGIWHDGQDASAIHPFGAKSAAMYARVEALRSRIDQFFSQCALVRYDARAAMHIGVQDDELKALDCSDSAAIREALARAPLASPTAEGSLPLGREANEAHRSQLLSFRDVVARVVLEADVDSISESQWQAITSAFDAHHAWAQAAPKSPLAELGVAALRDLLSTEYVSEIRALIDQDLAVQKQVKQIAELEKLVLFHQGIMTFVNNFASLPHLFNPESRALFEMGTLILWGRAYTFSIRVQNRAQHAKLAANSGIHLLYLQISGVTAADAFEVAVPVTRGRAAQFYVGQRGVFRTVENRELDAQVVQIVENPISFWELMKQPFRRAGTLLSDRVEQITSSMQKEAETSIIKAGDTLQKDLQTDLRDAQKAAPPPAATPAPAAAAPAKSGSARDLMIGTGFFMAGVGTAVKFLSETADKLKNPDTLLMLLQLVVAFIVIVGALTALNAFRKIRNRDLGVLLQAAGWAINGRMPLTRQLARIFSYKVRLPEGAKLYELDQLIPLARMARDKEGKGKREKDV